MKTTTSIASGLIALVCLTAGACEKIPTQPEVSVIEVAAVSTGGDIDESYEIVVGDIHRMIGPSAQTRLIVPPAVYPVEIRDVADNCALSGDPKRSIDLRDADAVRVVFELNCATTGLEVRTRTEGTDLPELLMLNVTGRGSTPMGLNTSLMVTRLQAGQYTVELKNAAGNCGSNAAIVEVKNRAITVVDFAITCGSIVRPELIVYSKDTTSSLNSVLELVRPDGTDNKRLLAGAAAAWSPDGKRVVYSDRQCGYWYYYYPTLCTGGLRVIDPETGSSRKLEQGDQGINPAWSPGGDVIAFDRWENGRFIYFLTLTGQATKLSIPGITDASDPDWSPDGSRIVFVCVLSYPVSDLCTVKPDGTGLVRLTSGSTYNRAPSWSRDGSRIAFTQLKLSNGEEEISLIDASGGSLATVAPGSNPSWSPDGSRILFNRADGLFTMNADGSDATRLTSGRHSGGAWRKTK